MKLKISDDLSLPLEAVTRTFAVMGIRGSGKTHTATVMVEEMLKAGQPVCIYDPVGAWFGLKTSADGRRPGFPVAIFGGEHQDVPLEETAGEMIAKVIVDRRIPAILDCSLMRKGARVRFMADFCETLYHINRQPLHFVADEAHTIAPLMTRKGEKSVEVSRALGAMEDIILLGRRRGLGSTIISQRPALVNTSVRTQCETLVAMRIVGPHDLTAIREWTDAHGTPEQSAELLPSLPMLKTGEGWFWSVWLDLFKRITFRQRETFDSGATPKVGQNTVTPKVVAEIDLKALGEKIQATVEKAKANDPANLKKRIAELERQLAQRPKEQVEKTVEKIVEVPVLKNGQLDRTEKIAGRLEDVIGKVTSEVAELRRLIAPAAAPRPAPRPVAVATARVERVAAARVAPAAATPRARESHDALLGKAERRILTALAQYPDGRLKKQVAVLTGYAIGGGGFNNAIGALRSRGYVEGSDPLRITQAGSDALGEYAPLPHGQELLDYWRAQLGKAEREILDVLAAVHPDSLTKEQLAAETPSQYAPEGGGFNNAIGRLRTLELVSGKRDALKASDDLFG